MLVIPLTGLDQRQEIPDTSESGLLSDFVPCPLHHLVPQPLPTFLHGLVGFFTSSPMCGSGSGLCTCSYMWVSARDTAHCSILHANSKVAAGRMPTDDGRRREEDGSPSCRWEELSAPHWSLSASWFPPRLRQRQAPQARPAPCCPPGSLQPFLESCFCSPALLDVFLPHCLNSLWSKQNL